MWKTYHLRTNIILWPEKEAFSTGTNSLFTPHLELNQFTSAENLTLCFQVIHLPVPHSAWLLRKGIFNSHFVFKTWSLTIRAQYWQILMLCFWTYDTSDFTRCKGWQEYPH